MKTFLLALLFSFVLEINAQSTSKELKEITSELNDIVDRTFHPFVENKALKLIKEGKNIYENSSEKKKLEKQYSKFISAESLIKDRVSEKYLSGYEGGKELLLSHGIPYYSYRSTLGYTKEAANKLIEFSVNPSLEADKNSLVEYDNYFSSLNTLYIKAEREMKKGYVAMFDSINSRFKNNKYYKDLDINFEDFICKNNRKYLKTLKFKMEWIAEHTENKSQPLTDIKEAFKLSERIAAEFIGDTCLNEYSARDTLAKYQGKIRDFNDSKPAISTPNVVELDVNNFTEQEKKIDCAVANKFIELTDALKTHFSKNKPSTMVLTAYYKNGLGMEYFRSYREQLTESGASFYDEIMKTVGLIMYNVENGASVSQKMGMVMLIAFASSDLTKRKEQLCGK